MMHAVKRGADEPATPSSEGKRTYWGGEEITEPLISDSDQHALSELSDKVKSSADEPARFSSEGKRTCRGGGEMTELLISGDLFSIDSDQSALSDLSDEVLSIMSKAVVSVALCKGRTVLFSCSGTAMDGKRMLTSASLAVAFDQAKKMQDDVVIEIRHEENVVIGILEGYDLKHQVAIVSVRFTLDCAACFHHDAEFLPHNKVVAVGRNVSGKFIGASGMVTASSAEDSECFMFSTCKFSEELQGGALFDLSGNFIGMNLFPVMDGSIFLPRMILCERLELEHLRTSWERRRFRELLEEARSEERITVPPIRSQFGYSLGYPEPSFHVINHGMVLVNTFEKPFGDIYPKGVWAAFRKRVASNISRNVVALASFNGKTRMFACTGVFIDFDDNCSTVLTSASLITCGGMKIVEGLRIVVLLPNKQRSEGTLKHYSLQYNVALVSVKDFHSLCPANLEHKWVDLSSIFVAVGRCYESGTLMAAKGVRSDRTGPLDCRILYYSTCKITKAGIGGPLVDIDGNFIGMNFYYPPIGAPFLFCDDLCGILKYFKTKNKNYQKLFGPSKCIVEDGNGPKNRWPVPKPCWDDPRSIEYFKNMEHPMAEYERKLRANGIPYRYEGEVILVLK